MTELTEFQRKIAALSLDLELRLNEPMAMHTSLRIGGAAEPEVRADLRRLCALFGMLAPAASGEARP